MPAATLKKPRKLFRIEISEGTGGSTTTTYYGTGEDAHDAYSDIVIYEQAEGHHVHQAELSMDVQVIEVDPATEKFTAWKCG